MMDEWILLRGLVRESRHWGGFVQEFEQVVPNAHAVLLDLPGNGLRCTEVSPATVEAMVEAYRAQLRAMGKLAPYRILAVSMGAMVAAEWSHRYPDEVAKQVLINTSMRPFSAFFQRLKPANYLRATRAVGDRYCADHHQPPARCGAAVLVHPAGAIAGSRQKPAAAVVGCCDLPRVHRTASRGDTGAGQCAGSPGRGGLLTCPGSSLEGATACTCVRRT